jgi:hypothetical protein
MLSLGQPFFVAGFNWIARDPFDSSSRPWPRLLTIRKTSTWPSILKAHPQTNFPLEPQLLRPWYIAGESPRGPAEVSSYSAVADQAEFCRQLRSH